MAKSTGVPMTIYRRKTTARYKKKVKAANKDAALLQQQERDFNLQTKYLRAITT